jgi:uncharacterized protein YggL (DUF469 family)
MRKRLRRKLRLAEFVELGFEATFRLPWVEDDSRLETFWDEFIRHIEARGLYCAGACGQRWNVVIYRGSSRAATEEDRTDITEWLETHGDVSDIHVGPLFDTWRAA